MAAEIHVGDVGTVFEATVKDEASVIVDISSATVRRLKFRTPDGRLLTKDAVLVNTGTDGKMKYTSVAGDLDVAGLWRVQGYVEIGTGKWHTDVHEFDVHPTY